MSSDFVSVDTMSAAAGYVSREFGDYGYSVRVCRAGFVNALCELRASDGGRRLFLIDRYGNVELAPDDRALDFDIGDRETIDLWTMAAADRLYVRRNGFQREPGTRPTVVS